MLRRFAPFALASLGLTGCPSEIDLAGRAGGGGVGEDDPRVVRDSGDLYASEALSTPRPAEPRPASGLGTDAPDETNGVCRLFAPRLPNPRCCPEEYGVDAARAQAVCGHGLYLGEHIRGTCGYYFASDGAGATWLRASFIPGEKTAQAAAAAHDLVFQRRAKRPEFRSEPVPGLPGAMWSRDGDLNWAFIPGWSKVRRITWEDAFCPRERMFELLAEIARAKEPPPGTARVGLVPVARG
jgi:hypothetical protein